MIRRLLITLLLYCDRPDVVELLRREARLVRLSRLDFVLAQALGGHQEGLKLPDRSWRQ